VQRAVVFWFSGLLLLAIPAFWPTYLFPPKYETDWHVHLHAAAMLAWMLLLIAQGALMRTGRRELHRALGKVSYGLVPLMLVSTALLAHYRLRQEINEEVLYFLYVQVALFTQLLIAWGLGIRHRREPLLHMRYMACTALTIIDPIVARLLFFGLGISFPETQFFTYALTDAILLALIRHDRRLGRPSRVYPAMLALFVASQAPTFFLYKVPAWRELAAAFAALPLP
jgi:uncharacterized membrane protein